MAEIIVIGIGNPFRGDDGVGWAVIDALHGLVPSSVILHKSGGDLGELLAQFENAQVVYVIDACKKEGKAGSWERLDVLQEMVHLERAQTSTHGLSIGQAISLAKTLHQLPKQLIIYAIYADKYRVGEGVSPQVKEAIPLVVQSLLKEEKIQACTKKA